jgi:phospholipid/cholesterol/gamma-HCH transport system permease protein
MTAIHHPEDGTAFLRPREGVDRSHVRSLWVEATRLLTERSPSRVVVDLGQVTRIDVAGVALLREIEQRCHRAGVEFATTNTAPAVSEFIEFVGGRSPTRRQARAPRAPRTASLSSQVREWVRSARDFAEFVGTVARNAVFLATHPHRLRFGEVLYQIQVAGAEGMLLVGALSLLLGVIMAFQGITGTRGFGSPIFVADVVTLSTTREMAPLLTGVIVTGRSGAAIAAEIGTMKIDQELDALSVMGLDVMRFLLVPRILALVTATPLLTLLSIAGGILGGAGVAVFVLHLTATNYFSEVQHAIAAAQIASALVKTATFGLIVGAIACFQGLQARQAAEDVGKQTTAAVVKGILLIIFADAFFSIVSEVYGW